MTVLRYFIFIILCLNLYTEVMGNFKTLSWGPKQHKERLLEKFLMDAGSHLTQNCPSRHTTILTPNNQLLKDVRPIFQDRPYFVGNNSKVMVQSREYAYENCVFLFSDRIDYDSSTLRHLPSDYNTKVQIVLTIDLSENEVENIFSVANYELMENVTIIFLENNEFKAFEIFPYTSNCTREIRLSFVWTADRGLKTYNYNYSPRNLNKCRIPISTLALESTITVRENPNGTLDILGGSEGNLILTFAEELNFTAAVKYPEIEEWEGEINNTVIGLLGDIANGKSVMAIGQMLPNLGKHEYSDFTSSYDHGCVTWATPLITATTEDVLYSEYQVYLWIAILLSIIFSCVFIYNLSRISSIDRKRKTYTEVILDVICSTLGISLHQVPADQPRRIYYVSYILYAMVVTVAYRTSLASILTVRQNMELIKSDEDIVELKIIPGGSNSTLSILKMQMEEHPYVSYLVANYEHIVDTATALKRIKYKKDFAFARDLTEIQYFKRNLILSGEEGSILTTKLNDIIQRLREFGFIDFWNREKNNVNIAETHEVGMILQKLKLTQLQSIFMLYLSGVILSTLTLISELIFSGLSKN